MLVRQADRRVGGGPVAPALGPDVLEQRQRRGRFDPRQPGQERAGVGPFDWRQHLDERPTLGKKRPGLVMLAQFEPALRDLADHVEFARGEIACLRLKHRRIKKSQLARAFRHRQRIDQRDQGIRAVGGIQNCLGDGRRLIGIGAGKRQGGSLLELVGPGSGLESRFLGPLEQLGRVKPA